MAGNKEHLWQAHIDGQLSAAEASAYENSLTPAERELLAADARFERRLGETLGQPVACPADVWQRALAKVQIENVAGPNPQAKRLRRWLWGGATLAAAASVAFGLSLALWPKGPLGAPSIALAAGSVRELRSQAQTDRTEKAAEAFLHVRNVDVRVVLDIDRLYAVTHYDHRMAFLGAGSELFEDQEIAELFFDCCNHPAKLVIAHQDSSAARALTRALGNYGDVQVVRDAGDYVVAVVGKHPAYDLIDMIATPH